jgi:integrase
MHSMLLTVHRGNWRVKYWHTVIQNGERKRTRTSTHLAPIDEDHRTKRSVLLLADKILAPLNAGQVQPESAYTVCYFIETFYLRFVEKELRPSTYKDYKRDIYEAHLKARLGELRLRDFRTVNGQRILRDIADSDSNSVGHKTLLRIKSFLSGCFKHAAQQGFLDGENPMRNTSAPRVKDEKPSEVGTYTMAEIEAIGMCLGEKDKRAFAVICVAAFAGLRKAELRGLRWGDYDGQTLQVSRSVWRKHVGPTKNPSSRASVPVLPILKKVLDDYRVRFPGAEHDYIFRGARGKTPLDLGNLVIRVIAPALAQYEYGELRWKGWHAFRRSLASNLYSCGVAPKIIQAILRHSDIGTTLQYYVQTSDAEARAALSKIEGWINEI